MHVEALTEKGRELFPRLAQFKDFYLVGGTALALQIGHRLSVDFDMFIDDDLPARLLEKIKRVFHDRSVFVMYNVPGQINTAVDKIKMTFFNYGYPPVEPLVKYEGVPMLSVEEIAASKAFSIGKRLSYKDYVDWYFLLKENHVTLADVIDIANKKYGGDFNDRLFLSQLASLDDIHTQPIDWLRDPADREDIQRELEKHIKEFKF